MYISNLVFGLALLGGSPPSAFAQTKRLSPMERGPKEAKKVLRNRVQHKKKAAAKEAEFGNGAQFIKEDNTLPLEEDKGSFLKSDAGSYDYDYDYSGSYDYDYDYSGSYDYDYGGDYNSTDDYGMYDGPHGHGGHHGPPGGNMIPPMEKEETSTMNKIAGKCPGEMFAMVDCYHGNEYQMITCVNCIWGTFEKDGMDCDNLQEDYVSCSEDCDSQCDEAVLGVYQCGLELLPCGEGKNSHASEGVYLAEE